MNIHGLPQSFKDQQQIQYVEEFAPAGGGYGLPGLFQSQMLPMVPPVMAVRKTKNPTNSFLNTFNNS